MYIALFKKEGWGFHEEILEAENEGVALQKAKDVVTQQRLNHNNHLILIRLLKQIETH